MAFRLCVIPGVKLVTSFVSVDRLNPCGLRR